MPYSQAELEAIFDQARGIGAPAERAAYLAESCKGKDDLRQRVEELLAASEQMSRFMEGGAAAAVDITVSEPLREGRGAQIGRYKLLEEIGEGGFGLVFLAEQKEPIHRRVALKLIKPGMDTRQVIARFEAERQALALMDHPSIAKVLDAGTTDSGRPYFVMELVRGVRITDYCDQAQLTPSERLDLFSDVCRAVQHAHQKGIVHRDIKPSNVLVTLQDGKPTVKVIDFGVAKALDRQLSEHSIYTSFHQIVGTPLYMSPEQTGMSSLDVDTRSDIYSLGVLLYELLTGSTPFDRERLAHGALAEVQRIIREEEPPKPSTKLSDSGDRLATIAAVRRTDPAKLTRLIRGDLDWIVMKCLEKDRNRRYSTVQALAHDIACYLQDEPISASPPSATYRLTKFLKRNKGAIASALTIFVALAAFAYGLISGRYQKQLLSANQRLATAEDQLQQVLYCRRVALALSEWQSNEAGRANSLLSECPTERRGWEWYYVHRLCHAELLTFMGHADEITSIAFSPDGTRIASSSVDKTLKLWDSHSGNEVRTIEHGDVCMCVAFSPDGSRLASGGGDATARLWDTDTGTSLGAMSGHKSAVFGLAFSPDGKSLASGSADGTVRVWDVATGQEKATLTGHSDNVFDVAFSPDGTRLASASWDGTVKVWDTKSSEEILTLKGHTSEVNSVAFSPDGKELVSGSADSTLKIWDAETGENIRTLAGHANCLWRVAYSPDGQRIASGSWDKTVRIWEVATASELFTLRGHTRKVFGVAFDPDGKRVVSGSEDGTAKLWDANIPQGPLTRKAHTGLVTSLAFSPDAQRLVTGSDDRTLKLWNVETGQEVSTFVGHSKSVLAVAFSPDGKQIVSSSADKTLKVWDARTGEESRTLIGHTNRVGSAAFSPDGRRIVSGSTDGDIKIWDGETGEEIVTLTGHTESIVSAIFTPDGTQVSSLSGDHTLRTWDLDTGREVCQLHAPTSDMLSVAFSADGEQIVIGGNDATLTVWNATNSREYSTLKGHTDKVWSVAFSPDGRRIVSGSWDNRLKVWDTESGQEMLSLSGHPEFVSSVAFSPDGRRIVSGDAFGEIKIWDAGPIIPQ